MYLGRIVEQGTRDELYNRPSHPYTQSLLSAAPVADPSLGRTRHRIILEGEIPNPAAQPSGFTFHPRCFRANERCRWDAPGARHLPDTSTLVACHYPDIAAEDPAVREASMEFGE
jgi:peptide/nickel transport system ATP-binding protein